MAAENIKYRFIQNVGDYFPAGYFGEDFIDKVQKASGLNADEMTALCKPYKRRSLKVPWNNPILAKDSTYPIQEEWNISNAM